MKHNNISFYNIACARRMLGQVAVVATMVLIPVLSGCDGAGLFGGSEPQPVPAEIAFEDRSTTPSSLSAPGTWVAASGVSARATLPSPSESLAPIREFYGLLGERVGSYTPTEFRLWIEDVVLYNDESFIALDVEVTEDSVADSSPHYADFVNDVVIAPERPVMSGSYTGMLFMFFVDNQSLQGGPDPLNPDYTVEIAPSIRITIPGYEGVWADRVDPNSGRHDIQDLGDGDYALVPGVLQPDFWTNTMTGSQTVNFRSGAEQIQRLEMFAYISGSQYRAILPGIDGHPDMWSPSEAGTMGIPSYGASGNWSAVVMPFEGVTIPDDATGISFRVQWDLDGIVEVYDHGTPGDTTDDVVVLAENFWERFSLVPIVD